MKWLGAVFISLALAILSYLFVDNRNIEYRKAVVKRDSYSLKISNYGTLEASKFVQIKSEIPSNRAKIIEIIDEGSRVKKGQIVARFDISAFMEEMNNLRYKINQAEALLSKTKKELEVFKRAGEDNIQKIKKSIQIAKINLRDVKLGSGKVKENELRQEIVREQRELNLVRDELDDFNSLLEKGYISTRERDKVENRFKNSQETLSIKKEKLKNYLQYEWKKLKSEHEIKLKELKEALESKKIQNSFELQNKKIQVSKAKNSLNYLKKELERVKTNIKLCDVKATIDGVILYREISKMGKRARVEIGDSIWQSQAFMQIPDTDKMIVKTYTREVDLNKVKVGMGVEVYLDAYPKKVLYGTITYIDTIADSRANENSTKRFKTIITIKNIEGFLRSGMSARVDIVYDEVKNRLTIPIEALHYNQERYFVYVDNQKDGIKREIEVGRMGKKQIEVLKNLNEGEVLLIR
ncbi:HlyD family efflux transporter periplasmic adaptor subunit [Sulfurovum sp. bin170]|uniref:efflux RND transporter periplasmic adaptor subunit n=1 Tax=Sulfurovum sp. bin170 TaxID=2695268 RepID=UPI0013DF7614|nr:efflux RND transporter periplasmic adaptor subunit [Sulfurovum sp. bin170]NEW61157.1 HlyD family efflux transporter periplasmic adaptor subunit [Sulfurovum sp. bin170]